MPVGGNAFQHAMIPGVLTAAGTLTLFGAIYVAHGFYNYFGPTTAFILLAIAILIVGYIGAGIVRNMIKRLMARRNNFFSAYPINATAYSIITDHWPSVLDRSRLIWFFR